MHRASIIDIVILPDFIAFITASKSFDGFAELNNTSAPANNAATQLFIEELAPFISRASVNINPSKFIFSCSKSVVITFDNDAGVPLLSNAGTERCPTITPESPASIYCLNGTKSILSNVDWSCDTVGNALCESTDVSPCPGKCLLTDNTPPSSRPRE